MDCLVYNMSLLQSQNIPSYYISPAEKHVFRSASMFARKHTAPNGAGHVGEGGSINISLLTERSDVV